MAVATKKIDTKILNSSIKENFESVKDGTGKALSQFDSSLDSLFSTIGDIVDKAMEAVGKVVNTVMSVVDKVMKTVGNIIGKVMGIVGKIISGIANIVRSAISGILNILKVPMEFLGQIFKKAMGFIKRLLQPFGALLPSKAWLKRNFNKIKDFFNTETGNIVKTGMLAGILGGVNHNESTLNNIIRVLSRDKDKRSILAAYRTLLSGGTGYNKYYYNNYFKLLESLYNPDGSNGTMYKIFKYLNTKRYLNIDYLRNEDNVLRGTAFKDYSKMGLHKRNYNDMILFSTYANIMDYDNYNMDYGIPYKTLKDRKRTDLSFEESINIINKASSLTRPIHLDNQDEESDIMQKYVHDIKVNNYKDKRYPYVDKKKFDNYNDREICKPTVILNNSKTSILPDLENEIEIERIKSTNGVKGHSVKSNAPRVDFNKFEHKRNIKEANRFQLRDSKKHKINITL